MGILKSILRIIAGLGIFEWGYHEDNVQKGVGNTCNMFFIGLCVWITFYMLLDIAEGLIK